MATHKDSLHGYTQDSLFGYTHRLSSWLHIKTLSTVMHRLSSWLTWTLLRAFFTETFFRDTHRDSIQSYKQTLFIATKTFHGYTQTFFRDTHRDSLQSYTQTHSMAKKTSWLHTGAFLRATHRDSLHGYTQTPQGYTQRLSLGLHKDSLQG